MADQIKPLHPVNEATNIIRRKLDALDRAVAIRKSGDTIQVEMELLDDVRVIVLLLQSPNL